MELNLLIADYIASTNEGKHMVGGLYADRKIVAFKAAGSPDPVVLPNLSFMATMNDVLAGTHAFQAEVVKPDCSSVWNSGSIKFHTQAQGTANFSFSISPFVIDQSGSYLFKAALDGDSVDVLFEIQITELQPQEGPTPE